MTIYRYEQLNIESLDSIRAYSKDVPTFLRNRPRRFVDHCINHMPPFVSAIARSAISSEGTGIFSVISPDSGKRYTVHIASSATVEAPDCTCIHWQDCHLPCKHMLAVFDAVPSWGFNSLPVEYTSFPHFNLDPNIHIVPAPALGTNVTVSVDNMDSDIGANESLDDLAPDDLDPTESYIVLDEVSMDESSAEDLAKLQSRARQHAQSIASFMYSLTDVKLLRETVDQLDIIRRN